MDLPTYTNIWRIEKRLYKLYDLRLPMPLPLVQIGVFFGIFVPWIVLLQLLRVPFHTPWHVVYLVPPGVLTWLSTRPVIEGKRLTELLISQIRYLTEAKTWARLTPIREPDEVAIVGRVWLRRRGISGQVHAGRQGSHGAERQAAPIHMDAAAGQAPARQTVPPLQSPLNRADAAAGQAVALHAASETQARTPRPSLRPTPHDGTTTVPPAGSPGSPPGRRGRGSGERRGARPAAGDPRATRTDNPRVTRTDNPRMSRADDPNATRVDAERPGAGGHGTADPAVTRPEPIRRGPVPPAPRHARGFPAPAGPPDAGPADHREEADHPERPAARAADTEPAQQRATGAPRHGTGRRRSTSHEPEHPAATSGPAAAGRPPAYTPSAASGTPSTPTRPGTPGTPGKPAASDRPGISAASDRPGSGAPGVPPASVPFGVPPALGQANIPAAPGRSGEADEKPDASAEHGRPDAAVGPRPAASLPPPPPGDRPEENRAATSSDERTDESTEPDTEAAEDAGRSDEGTPTAPVIRLVPGGRHPRSGGRHPAAHEPQGASGTSGPGHDDSPAGTGSGTGSDSSAAASPDDRRDAIAEARTDQIVWPARPRRESASGPGADETPLPSTPSTTPSRSATPGPFARPGGQGRGRSHGEEPVASREGRQVPSGGTPPRPNTGKTAPGPAQPAQRPAGPGTPPKAPAARLTPPSQIALPGAPPQQGTPARPAPPARRSPPQNPPRTWPEQTAAPTESPARGVRSGPASPVRPRPLPQAAHEQESRDDGRGRRRIFSGGGHGDGDYEQRVRTAFEGARRVVVLGCTGGAGQTVTALMLGHTFAQHRGDHIVAVDINPGPGAMARRTRSETRETLTSLITHAEQVTGYQMMRRYTSVSKSGLEVVAAGKNPVQALDDRDYALAMRTLDRYYSVTLLDAAAAVVARVLPYADQIVLVAPASSDAPRAVAMTFEWLDGNGYEDLRAKAVTVINGVSRRSMDDVEQAEAVARGRCRALVRIPWDDHLSLDRAPRNELRTLRASTRKAYIALGGVVAGGLVPIPDRYPRQEVSR